MNPSPPASLTAIASSAVDGPPAMGAWTIGCLSSSRIITLVTAAGPRMIQSTAAARSPYGGGCPRGPGGGTPFPPRGGETLPAPPHRPPHRATRPLPALRGTPPTPGGARPRPRTAPAQDEQPPPA